MVTWLPQNEISRSNYLVLLLLTTKTQTLIIHETSTCPKMSHCFLLDQLPFESACLLGPFRTYFGLQGMLAGWFLSLAIDWNGKIFCECRAETSFSPTWAAIQTAKLKIFWGHREVNSLQETACWGTPIPCYIGVGQDLQKCKLSVCLTFEG